MAKEAELFQQHKYDELWQRCCGFIDLSLSEFMAIQTRLLTEQIDMLQRCELGRFIFNGANPLSIESFRKQIPLTTYEDYADFLIHKRESALPAETALWQYTSGKSGEYPFRWAPVTKAQLDEIRSLLLALLLFSGCKDRYDVVFKQNDRVLYGMAPPPYATGSMARVFPYELFKFLPSVDEAEKESFDQRMQRGFDLALSEGLDVILAMSSVVVAIGERFEQRGGSTHLRKLITKPSSLYRLAQGLLKSKLAGRKLMPKDLWTLKGLITFGIDSSIYENKIEEMWGVKPLEFHGCTEAVVVAMQTWDHKGMTFIPSLNLFEFIPEEESLKSRQSTSYQPSTLLMNELKPGNYELVITSFRGGPFVRYRTGHLIEIISLRNDILNIDIPQMNFLTRVDDQIDIAGFTRLSEKVIWQAMENTGIAYAGWTVRKEIKEKPILHLYIELKETGEYTEEQVTQAVHRELKKLDTPYAELESFIGLRPLTVTLLPARSFERYEVKQKEETRNSIHLQPPHLNPAESTIQFLLNGR